ncbi:MAG: thiolase family protein [Candidatus Eisenbacteria bacterium]|nr:thiolase family protein [Candidatus Eisenbacteria bacterium]
MSANDLVIVAARRTPIGRFLGSLAGQTGVDLGLTAAQAALADLRAQGLTELPNPRVVFGSARPAGTGPNPARQLAVRAGLGHGVVASTVNMACASGMEAVAQGARLLLADEARAVLVGGMEAMSRVPFLLDRMRTGYRLGHAPVDDGMYRDGFLCPLSGKIMGETAETLAREYAISRQEQDAFALESQERAARALAEGRFRSEIAPVALTTKAGTQGFTLDEHARADTTPASLAKLPPVFAADGSVTAGNSSGITDGAAALILMRRIEAEAHGLDVLAVLRAWRSAGVDPARMGIGPVPVVRALVEADGLPLDRYDLVELNEAFAAQVIACDRELHFDRARLNVNGGAIALGHPVGASGARILVTLIHELRRRGGGRGLATLCVSGGMGLAMSIEVSPSSIGVRPA